MSEAGIALIATSEAPGPAGGCAALSADGTRLWYSDTGGDGDAVLFLHGFSGSSSAARHFADATRAAGYRFVSPDLRGHGMSDKPVHQGAYGLPRFVEDFEALMAVCKVDRVHLVGHCMGGMVALACAAALPRRVASLALVGTSLRPADDQQLAAWAEQRSPQWVRSLARRAFPSDGSAPAHVDYSAFDDTGDWYWRRMVADYRALSADTAFAILAQLDDLDLTGAAASITAPTLVVHGARDTVFPPVSAQRIADVLPGARLRILPEDNHVSLVLTATSALYGEVIAFVRETGAGAVSS